MTDEMKFWEIKSQTLGVDDTFRFRCKQCGKCCTHREDIILSPMDIFRMAKQKKMTPGEFYNRYCDSHVGPTSGLPVVRLEPVGEDLHCPLLKNNKCSVHKSKPAACAMFPLGRYIFSDPDSYNEKGFAEAKVNYYLQPVTCGDDRNETTVREWLKGFNIEAEDEMFVRWQQVMAAFHERMQAYEKNNDAIASMAACNLIQDVMYFCYDSKKPFREQFEENVEAMLDMMEDPAAVKRVAREHMGLANWLRACAMVKAASL